jgi:TIR domain
MPQDYVYDIFISYRHKGPAYSWVTETFHPLLAQWLPDFVPVEYDVKIAMNSQVEAADTEWPDELRHKLRMSRCLLTILSPEYFRSKWCQTELQMMQQREQFLGLRTGKNPSALIYKVVFASPELLPPECQKIEGKDMRQWATIYSNFRNSHNFELFESEMKDMCTKLWPMIQRAPAWQDWYDIVTPPGPPQRVAVRLPRFG